MRQLRDTRAAGRAGIALTIVSSLLAAMTASVFAQGCVDKVGEATAPEGNAALLQAYEAMLRGTDPGLWKAWDSSSRRLAEAPGYSVRKMGSTCTVNGTQ